MIPGGRKYPNLMRAVAVIAVAAAGWAFYYWTQTRHANVVKTPPLVSLTQTASDFDATRRTISTDLIQAPAFSFPIKPTMPATTDPDKSIVQMDQSRSLVDQYIVDMVRETIRYDFPELDLAESDLLDLSETIFRLQQALASLRNTSRDAENVEHIRQLEDIRDNAMWDFERITGMLLHEFLYRLSTNGGIDNEKIDNAEISLERLSDYQP